MKATSHGDVVFGIGEGKGGVVVLDPCHLEHGVHVDVDRFVCAVDGEGDESCHFANISVFALGDLHPSRAVGNRTIRFSLHFPSYQIPARRWLSRARWWRDVHHWRRCGARFIVRPAARRWVVANEVV